jgi:hypothetical protein
MRGDRNGADLIQKRGPFKMWHTARSIDFKAALNRVLLRREAGVES